MKNKTFTKINLFEFPVDSTFTDWTGKEYTTTQLEHSANVVHAVCEHGFKHIFLGGIFLAKPSIYTKF